MCKFHRIIFIAVLACASANAFADNMLWQGSWTNSSDKAILLKTNASQCFDPGQFSNNYLILPGANQVIRATATTDFPMCVGGDYWLVINVIEADHPSVIQGQVTMKFLNSAGECYLTSDQAGISAPSTACPPEGNTASYSVEIEQVDQCDLFWGLRFPEAGAGSGN